MRWLGSIIRMRSFATSLLATTSRHLASGEPQFALHGLLCLCAALSLGQPWNCKYKVFNHETNACNLSKISDGFRVRSKLWVNMLRPLIAGPDVKEVSAIGEAIKGRMTSNIARHKELCAQLNSTVISSEPLKDCVFRIDTAVDW